MDLKEKEQYYQMGIKISQIIQNRCRKQYGEANHQNGQFILRSEYQG